MKGTPVKAKAVKAKAVKAKAVKAKAVKAKAVKAKAVKGTPVKGTPVKGTRMKGTPVKAKAQGARMATYKQPAGALYFQLARPAFLMLCLDGHPGWLFGGSFASKKQALAALDTIRARGADPANYQITHNKTGGHYYFTLRGPKGENLGGRGSFGSEQAAREAIAYVAAYLPMVSIMRV